MSDQPLQSKQQTLRYCTTCPRMCRFSCPVAHVEARETVTPWGLVSLLNMVDKGAIPMDAEVAEVLGHCTGCTRCQTACLHDFHIPSLIFEGRQLARDAGFPVGPSGEAPAPVLGEQLNFPEQAKVCFWSDESTHDFASISLFGALFEFFEVSAQRPPKGAPTHSGYDLLASGQRAAYLQHVQALADVLKPFELVITDSPELLTLLRTKAWSTPWKEAGLNPDCVLHWSEVLAGKLDSLDDEKRPAPTATKVTYHDASNLGRGAGIYDAPRALLRWALGDDALVEMDDSFAESIACGAGAGYTEAAPQHAKALAQGLLRDAARAGAEYLVSAAPKCTEHLEHPNLEALPAVTSLVELLFETLSL